MVWAEARFAPTKSSPATKSLSLVHMLAMSLTKPDCAMQNLFNVKHEIQGPELLAELYGSNLCLTLLLLTGRQGTTRLF